MASTKEPHARSSSHHRLSSSSMGSANLPVRQPHARHHSHSLSMGSMNQTHRVTRRKSMSSNTNAAAVAAALKEAGEAPLPTHLSASHRRSMNAKLGGPSSKVTNRVSEQDLLGVGHPSFGPSSVPDHASVLAQSDAFGSESSSAVADGPPLPAQPASMSKARIRRASEGSHLSKSDGKRVSGGELRCEKCGKGYKHSSCLTKHLWEHTPEWSYTSKLLISKHQQVQLLEAASVLVNMNQDETTPPGSAKEFVSDDSSASPSASGSSGLRDGVSSTDTTPPPMTEEGFPVAHSNRNSRIGRTKRRSSNASSLSRSARANSITVGSAPSYGSAFAHHRNSSGDPRPATSGSVFSAPDEDEAGLAAAVGLLSCSFGTPRSGPLNMAQDVPPVPPLPARFQGSQTLSGGTITPAQAAGASFQAQAEAAASRDVNMDESEESNAEDEDDSDRRSPSRGHSDEDDDGIIFGGMEQ